MKKTQATRKGHTGASDILVMFVSEPKRRVHGLPCIILIKSVHLCYKHTSYDELLKAKGSKGRH